MNSGRRGTGRRGPLFGRAACAGVVVVVAMLLASPASADGAMRPGIDVSRFQGEINWNLVGQTNVKFAFVQASRGSGNDCAVAPSRCGADEFYRRNYRRARANGIRVGPYHRAFARGGRPKAARTNARRQARLFNSTVGKLRGGDLRPALDFEHPFGRMSPKLLRIWVRKWLEVVQRRFGAKPIIYTNNSSWQATGNVRGFARRGHPLWVAHWVSRRSQISVPARNWAGRGWSVWQYTSQGKVRGIQGRVDRDRMRVPFRRLRVG